MVRRNGVINEALAEEVQSGEQRKKSGYDAAAAMPEPETTASRDLRENPIESDPNPKRRLLMKSAS